MNKQALHQYTLRNIPANLDLALRKKAQDSGKSLNETVLETLAAGIGEKIKKRNLHFIIGSMNQQEAEELEQSIDMQRKIDPELWK